MLVAKGVGMKELLVWWGSCHGQGRWQLVVVEFDRMRGGSGLVDDS